MSENTKLRLRSEIEDKYKWNLEKIYPTNEAWEEDYARLADLGAAAAAFAGTLAESPAQLAAALKAQDELGMLLEKVYVYASMRQDEDNNQPLYQGMRSRIETLYVQISSQLAWFEPELLAIPADKLEEWLATDELAPYAIAIRHTTRMRDHILSDKEEAILAKTGEMAGAFDTVYSLLTDADMSFPHITNEHGESEQLTHGNYIRLLRSHDRRVREAAFTAEYETYDSLKNTISATYAASVKKDCFYAEVRGYESALAASLDGDNVPVSVYENLIATIRANLPLYHRYLALRKKVMGLDELHMYDVYVPMVKAERIPYSYDQAIDTVIEALALLGEEYCATLKSGLTGGWVDVYENKGKTSGAYSGGAYLTDPYILLNFQNDLNSTFTLAHEGGHSMHSYLSKKHQPYTYAGYRIFVAEVASTVNENLLIHHLLKKAKSDAERVQLLNHYLEEFRATVFRQTMFAEFEKTAHEWAEAGKPLTEEALSAYYHQLNKDYFGEGVVSDPLIAKEWMRIPHFYRAFYVYKYSTGFCAATALAAALLDEDPAKAAAAQQRYLSFLSAGCTKDPIDLLKDAGVDMTGTEPLQKAFDSFNAMLSELEKLV